MSRREQSRFDILTKIEVEREKREWTEYTLSKKSHVAQSTISTWYRKKLQPSVASIEKICDGFGITLSEFFNQSPDGARSALSAEERTLYQVWSRLSPDQRHAVLGLLISFEQEK